MKLTGISIGPSGFSSVLDPSGPPGPLPDSEVVELALFITNRIYSETNETYSVAQIFQPETFELIQRHPMTDESEYYATSEFTDGADYVLGQAKQVGSSVFVLAKAGFSYLSGDAPLGEDLWAIIEFTDPASDLVSKSIHAIGSSEGTLLGATFLYTLTMMVIIDEVAYINVVPLDPDTNEPIDSTDPPHAGLYGYPIGGGTDVFRNEHADSEVAPRDIAVTTDGANIYTSGETEADSATIYKGTPADPFNTAWFSDASIIIIWSIIGVNPEDNHVFCWAVDDTGFDHPALFFVLELDEDGTIVQKIDVTTTAFTINTAIPGPGCISKGKLYTTIYLRDAGSTEEIYDGVWVINISDASGAGDPEFIIGETPPTDDDFFGSGIIYGIEMVGVFE